MTIRAWLTGLREFVRRRRERVVQAGDIAFLFEADAWRRVGPNERPDLFEAEVCRGCGCTEFRACPGGCWWVARGLCSRCWSTYGGTD